MARITQTKKESLQSGGPQYYLHGLAKHIREFLRKRKELPVRLWTPYGMIETDLKAVPITRGDVGHDRIQGRPSVARRLFEWFALKVGDIDYVDVAESIDHEQFLVIRPEKLKYYRKARPISLSADLHPLTLVRGYYSPLWTAHLQDWRTKAPDSQWVLDQISALVKEHDERPGRIHESDLLRISGALDRLGVKLGVYRTEDVDCPNASFCLRHYPVYPCPVEVEKYSSGFQAAHHRKRGHHKKRLVVLCMQHDEPSVRQAYVDVIELRELERILREHA